jgi:hypothetical protein
MDEDYHIFWFMKRLRKWEEDGSELSKLSEVNLISQLWFGSCFISFHLCSALKKPIGRQFWKPNKQKYWTHNSSINQFKPLSYSSSAWIQIKFNSCWSHSLLDCYIPFLTYKYFCPTFIIKF